jgi:hypothetical protein
MAMARYGKPPVLKVITAYTWKLPFGLDGSPYSWSEWNICEILSFSGKRKFFYRFSPLLVQNMWSKKIGPGVG